MARQLAKRINYIYIDSGAMYRAVTLFCLQNNLFSTEGNLDEEKLKESIQNIEVCFRLNPQTSCPETYLDGVNVEEKIRSMEVSDKVSIVSAVGFVRRQMVCQQQRMGESKGIVMDGRDIGTVVFPNAELKIFVTASPQVRAQRRLKELESKGVKATLEEVLENIEKRDYIDQHRAESPLRKADDAIVLDNTDLTVEEQMQWLLDRYNEVINEQ